jgi:signal transduction histidine kinase
MTELGRTHRGLSLSTSLNAVVEQALACAEPQLQRQGIQLKRDFDPRVPEVLIDVTRMEAAVSRVIANAATAMPIGGVMTVSTRHRPDEQVIDLEVTDTDCETGPARERQLSGVRSSSGLKEAGLGLIAALQTFADHGGDVSLRILPGQGCSVVARLPVTGRAGRP